MNKNYDAVESLSNFRTQLELERYRSMLLKKTAEQAEFISKLMGRPFSALELCCGNGRLLIGLANRGMLTTGVGIDSAASRIAFGREWAEEYGFNQIQLVNDSIKPALDILYNGQQYDVAICITGAFQYFLPQSGLDGLDVLDMMSANAPVCILELYNVPETRKMMLALNNGHIKTWDILPPDDPFAYYMDSYTYDSNTHIMAHDKVFIHRSGSIDDGRSELLYYYDTDELLCMLENIGYTQVSLFSDWAGSPYDPRSDTTIVVGRLL